MMSMSFRSFFSCGRLRSHNLQIGIEPTDISVVEYLLCRLCRQSCLMLMRRLLIENAQSDQIVFHLLKRSQGSLSIVGDSLVVAGIGLFGDSGSSSRIEHRLR